MMEGRKLELTSLGPLAIDVLKSNKILNLEGIITPKYRQAMDWALSQPSEGVGTITPESGPHIRHSRKLHVLIALGMTLGFSTSTNKKQQKVVFYCNELRQKLSL